jgi:uncharacterized peroxidase-related enzyme
MGQFKLVRDTSLQPELRELYGDIMGCGFESEGAPGNWFTSQGERPDVLRATWPLVKMILTEGQLPPTLKQLISMVVSQRNDCRYCAVAHTNALQTLGVSEEIIKSATNDPDMQSVPPAQRAACLFAIKAAKTPLAIEASDYAALREAGYNQGEIMEIVMLAAANNFINTWADASGIAVDPER